MQAQKQFNWWEIWWCGIQRNDLPVHKLWDILTFKLDKTSQNPYNNSRNSLCSKGNSHKCSNKQKVLCIRRDETLSGLTLAVEMKTNDLSQILWYKTRQMPREVGGKDGVKGLRIVRMSLNHCWMRLIQSQCHIARRLVTTLLHI